MPEGMTAPRSCEVDQLPPLVIDQDGRMRALDPGLSVQQALDLRRDRMLRDVAENAPAAIVIELYPFGRKKFDRELLPLLDAVRSSAPRPIIVCSLRDLLVDRGDDQSDHDERARAIVDTYFDAVLVHADPAFARIEESFHPRQPMRTPVHYTGFVAAALARRKHGHRSGILVSGGGGRFAESLYLAAIEAHQLRSTSSGSKELLTLVAGPLCEPLTWDKLVDAARDVPMVRLCRSVRDLSAAMEAARASISQCGYNTALDIVRARVPALVVPFAERGESEQTERARRLEALGVLRTFPADRLDPSGLATAIDEMRTFVPAPASLDLNGAERTARLLEAMAQGGAGSELQRTVIHERMA